MFMCKKTTYKNLKFNRSRLDPNSQMIRVNNLQLQLQQIQTTPEVSDDPWEEHSASGSMDSHM